MIIIEADNESVEIICIIMPTLYIFEILHNKKLEN